MSTPDGYPATTTHHGSKFRRLVVAAFLAVSILFTGILALTTVI